MSEVDFTPRRLFTIDEANAMLPLVRAITADLSSLARDLAERQERLAALKSHRKGKQPPHDIYTDEVEQVQADLASDFVRMKEYLQELAELGVEPKSALEGLVDFPAMLDGRVVFLCWRLGEAEVAHWHEIGDGFAGRQLLPAASVAGAGPLNGASDFVGGELGTD